MIGGKNLNKKRGMWIGKVFAPYSKKAALELLTVRAVTKSELAKKYDIHISKKDEEKIIRDRKRMIEKWGKEAKRLTKG